MRRTTLIVLAQRHDDSAVVEEPVMDLNQYKGKSKTVM
jgi:hypothetical protein